MERCTNCDFLGQALRDGEEYDLTCPECGEECNEYEEATTEQEEACEAFFDNKDAFMIPKGGDESSRYGLLFDDYDLVRKALQDNDDLFCYTLVSCDGDQDWILKGWHFVNRMGYFLTTREIEIPEEGLRVC